MADRQSLDWVHRNRTRSDRANSAGAVLEALSRRLTCGELSDAASKLAGLVDAEFRGHCRIASLVRGKLVINVDEAPLVYSLRLRWGSLIERELRGVRFGGSVTRVVFEYGKTGVRISGSSSKIDLQNTGRRRSPEWRPWNNAARH